MRAVKIKIQEEPGEGCPGRPYRPERSLRRRGRRELPRSTPKPGPGDLAFQRAAKGGGDADPKPDPVALGLRGDGAEFGQGLPDGFVHVVQVVFFAGGKNEVQVRQARFPAGAVAAEIGNEGAGGPAGPRSGGRPRAGLR